MWALGVACYRDMYLTSLDGRIGRMAKWDIDNLMSRDLTGTWDKPSILSIVLPAVLCFIGPFVGALWSRAEGRRAMLAGMTGAFLSILGFPAPLGMEAASAGLLAGAASTLMVIVFALPFAAAVGAAGGLAGAAIRKRRAPDPDHAPSFTLERAPGETALHHLVREAALVREALDDPSDEMTTSMTTLVFAWVESAQALPESDRHTLADLGLDVARLLPWLEAPSAEHRRRIADWLAHFEATIERGNGRSTYR